MPMKDTVPEGSLQPARVDGGLPIGLVTKPNGVEPEVLQSG